MAARMLATLAVAVALPLGVHALLAGREIVRQGDEQASQRLELQSRSYAAGLMERLAAAETVGRALSADDVGPGGQRLRERVLDSRAFRDVEMFEAGSESALTALMRTPVRSARAALEGGQTALITGPRGDGPRTVYLLRGVRAAGRPALALFEISPKWLWGGAPRNGGTADITVMEADGAVLRGATGATAELAALVERGDLGFAERPDSAGLAWQHEGAEWRAALVRVPVDSEYRAAGSWAVIAAAPRPRSLALAAVAARTVPAALACALLAALAGAGYLARSYVPGLRGLRRALLATGEVSVERPPPAADEAGEVLEAWEKAAAVTRDRLRTLGVLSEIDRLLLSSSELEATLDAILARVRAVTHCHSVGITLLDADAPAHGRVYVASDGVNGQPVSRVALDPDMLGVLAGAQDGLTVARCEEQRHSFLAPLRERGAEFFWIWPVRAGERLLAILAVGYPDAPLLDAETAHYGSEFAARLAIALSNNARDEQLYRQAYFDPLTQLPNRLLFRDRLAQELASVTAGTARGALLYIDLDHFKKINDTIGHSAGDQLLVIVGQRLRACVKDGDTVARLGGDEFTVILRNVADPDAARTIGERIIESLQLPVNLGGRDHFVRASIGITLFPDDGASIDVLMRNADVAMYRAKASGRSRVTFFDRHMMRGVAGGTVTESGLFRALRRREFSLYYQPQFDVATGALTGLEALLRWQTPRDGLRYPHEIVPAAEESGLIADIGGWVLDAACAQLAAWRARGIAPPRLAVNVSVQQLKHTEFPQVVRRALDRHGLPPELLEIELTEAVFADVRASEELLRLAELGVRLALDDFGTGYSSLSHLRQYPVHVLKIDRSCIEQVAQDPAAAALAEAIIVMAHTLDRRVAAEGVETLEQLDFLRERRCDFVQGFYLAKPMSGAAVTELLESRVEHAMSAAGGDRRAAG